MSITRGAAIACTLGGLMIVSAVEDVRGQQPKPAEQQVESVDGPLARAVRQATSTLKDTTAAVAAGYVLASGCVSGPEDGAMGVHYVKEALVGDGVLDAAQPEALVFEPKNGELQLAAVEYLVLAAQWDASNDHPPILNGQHFHYVSAPNRSGLPAYYELHVWAWQRNPRGTFADWNPRVSCDSYVPQPQ